MYIEHPYFYEGKYYANIDGEMIEITKEVAYAMNNFYRSSKAKKVEIKNEEGKVVDKMLWSVLFRSIISSKNVFTSYNPIAASSSCSLYEMSRQLLLDIQLSWCNLGSP